MVVGLKGNAEGSTEVLDPSPISESVNFALVSCPISRRARLPSAVGSSPGQSTAHLQSGLPVTGVTLNVSVARHYRLSAAGALT